MDCDLLLVRRKVTKRQQNLCHQTFQHQPVPLGSQVLQFEAIQFYVILLSTTQSLRGAEITNLGFLQHQEWKDHIQFKP